MKPYSLEFKHFELPATPNQLLGAHWSKRAKHANKWERLVWKYVWPFKPAQPLRRATLTFMRGSSRELDPDNLPGSFKAVQDALVKCGIILDDNNNVITAYYLQEKAPPGKGYVKVRVEGF